MNDGDGVCVAASPARVGGRSEPEQSNIVGVGHAEGVCTTDLGEDVADMVEGKVIGLEGLAAAVDADLANVGF